MAARLARDRQALLEEGTRAWAIILGEGHVAEPGQQAGDPRTVVEPTEDLQALAEQRARLGVVALLLHEPAEAGEHLAGHARVLELPRDAQALVEQRPRPRIVSQLVGQDAGPVERLDPRRRGRHDRGERQDGLDPLARLRGAAAGPPEAPEGRAQPQDRLGVAALRGPAP